MPDLTPRAGCASTCLSAHSCAMASPLFGSFFLTEEGQRYLEKEREMLASGNAKEHFEGLSKLTEKIF